MHDDILKIVKDPSKKSINDPFGGFYQGHVKFKSPEHLDHHLKNSSFSILSAEKPPVDRDSHYHSLSDTAKKELNESRSKELEEHLNNIGAVYHKVLGDYGEPENSFLIYHSNGVTPNHLNDLAEKYKQDSILHWDKGQGHLFKAQSKDGKGPRDFKYGKKDLEFSGHKMSPGAPAFYTQPKELDASGRFETISKNENGKKTGFSVIDSRGRKHSVIFNSKRLK